MLAALSPLDAQSSALQGDSVQEFWTKVAGQGADQGRFAGAQCENGGEQLVATYRSNAPYKRDDRAYVAKMDLDLDKSARQTVSVRGTLTDLALSVATLATNAGTSL